MKGIIFSGCSFTWGQGLYYYSGLPTLVEPPPNTYDSTLITPAHLRYMQTLRYPRLVANHFNTFEVVSKQNGGSEESSMNFIKAAFGLKEGFSHFTEDAFSFDEIEYVIIQTSQVNRNSFYYNYKGEDKWFNINVAETKSDFYEWLIESAGITLPEWQERHINFYFEELKSLMKYLEDLNIKTRILCWENDYIDLIRNDIFTYNRFIELNFRGKNFKSIRDLMNEHTHLAICNDYDNFKSPPQDHHPSKECHEVIAQNIISSIEKDINKERGKEFEPILEDFSNLQFSKPSEDNQPKETPKRSLI